MGLPVITTRQNGASEVIEQGRSYWLPIQDEVLSELARLLNPGQEFTVFVRYAGASLAVPERLYLLVDFDADRQLLRQSADNRNNQG